MKNFHSGYILISGDLKGSKNILSQEYDLSVEKKKNCAKAYNSENLTIKMEGQVLTFRTILIVVVVLLLAHLLSLCLLALTSQTKYTA